MLKEIVDFIELELTARGIVDSHVPVIVLGVQFFVMSVVVGFFFRLRGKCKGIKCEKVEQTLNSIDLVSKEVSELNTKVGDSTELIEHKKKIDELHKDVLRLSGLIYGLSARNNNKQRKVITHD